MEPRWMKYAWACFGVREYSGPRSNAAVVQMYRDAGHSAIQNDTVPWCAAFVGACLVRSGVTATGSLRARSYQEWGRELQEPIYGAVAVLSRGANPALGHVGFVVGETETHLFLLGGNQSNAVTVGKYPKSRLLSFRTLALPKADSSERSAEPDSTNSTQPADGFDSCLPHVLEMEGGFSDDPHDPGGPTNRGVTLKTWARFRGTALNDRSRAALVASLKAISKRDLETIYRDRYWTPSRAEELPVGADLAHFDASVNHGITGGAKLLQQTLGVAEDGEIGPITLGAAWSIPVETLIVRHSGIRAERYRALPHFWRFGRGWLRRTHATERAAHDRALRQTKPPRTTRPEPVNRSIHQPSEELSMSKTDTAGPTKHWTKSLTLWGAFVTTLATVMPMVGPFFGFNVSADMIKELGDQGLKVLQAIATFTGLAMTIAGRLRATSRLSR